ncbi:MAG TPA: hypothetical protein VMS79_00120 [Methanomassiliicoccales archaeon]|nr:hypothetical protein [Methanomassiliicoccales archaeon]
MEMEGQMPIPTRMPGFAWRVSASILLGCAWLAFLIIWLFFYAANWDVYQNLAIILVSIIIVIGCLAAMWASFGMKMADRAEKMSGEAMPWRQEIRHWRRRGIVPMILWLGWLVFLVIWLFFYAGSYNVYQNLAILIVSLIIAGGVSSVVWRTTWRWYR